MGDRGARKDRGERRALTRRQALAGAAAAGVGAAAAGAGLDHVLVGGGAASLAPAGAGATVPFHGAHQAGIATSAQGFLQFAAFDVTSQRRADLRELLRRWTDAARELTAGRPYEHGSQSASRAPSDTGESLGLGPARLTLTFGFGPSLFGAGTRDRFGLAARRPAALRPLPSFANESLDPQRSGGDLCVQACADDPQVAFHALHVLSRLAEGAAVLRWSQPGFRRMASSGRAQLTPRNLMGFKDGTDNVRGEDARAMDAHVWVARGEGPDWMAGGTYLVARRIQIVFEAWDQTSLVEQERTIGRHKLSGAPLGARREHDAVDLQARVDGRPAIPADAHIRLASPSYNGGRRILRRGYSYSESARLGAGAVEGGLFFIAFQGHPSQFTTIQRRLSESDALNRHIVHTASAIFVCPPGAAHAGQIVGETLLA